VTLPGVGDRAVVGADGRLLLVNVPSLQQLVVFDLKSTSIVKTLSMSEVQILFAAGRDHLMVYLPGADKLERWSLTTFTKEDTVPNSAGGPIKALALGSASAGPLVLHVPSQSQPTLGILLYDPRTLKPATETIDPIQGQPFGVKVDPAAACVAVSADGRAIVLRGTFEFTVLTRRGATWQGRNFRGTVPVPSADGQVIIDNGQAFSTDGQALGPKRGAHWSSVWCIPCLQGGLTLALTETRQGKIDWADFHLALHVGGEAEPLVEFPFTIDGISGLVDWVMGRWPPLERHVFASPELGVLAVLPAKKDRIDFHRFNFDEMLKNSPRDYLFVSSQPLTGVTKGATYRYSVAVKSKKGEVKMQLVSAPPGMNLSADGVLSWVVPADFAAAETDVAMSIRDGSGKEVRHAFSIRVGEK
jgi:hypothetical protein